MFENLKEVLNKVYVLANERRIEEESTYVDGIKVDNLDSLDIENWGYSKKEQELFNFLNSLDFESVKIIQTIMYIGRDHDYDKTDSYEAGYEDYRKSLDSNGWNDKEIEVSQIVQKVPLDIYLKDGFDILGINL
jgi:hypothetical protein